MLEEAVEVVPLVMVALVVVLVEGCSRKTLMGTKYLKLVQDAIRSSNTRFLGAK